MQFTRGMIGEGCTRERELTRYWHAFLWKHQVNAHINSPAMYFPLLFVHPSHCFIGKEPSFLKMWSVINPDAGIVNNQTAGRWELLYIFYSFLGFEQPHIQKMVVGKLLTVIFSLWLLIFGNQEEQWPYFPTSKQGAYIFSHKLIGYVSQNLFSIKKKSNSIVLSSVNAKRELHCWFNLLSNYCI